MCSTVCFGTVSAQPHRMLWQCLQHKSLYGVYGCLARCRHMWHMVASVSTDAFTVTVLLTVTVESSCMHGWQSVVYWVGPMHALRCYMFVWVQAAPSYEKLSLLACHVAACLCVSACLAWRVQQVYLLLLSWRKCLANLRGPARGSVKPVAGHHHIILMFWSGSQTV